MLTKYIRRPLIPFALLSVMVSLVLSSFYLPKKYEKDGALLKDELFSSGVIGTLEKITKKDDGCVLQLNTDHGKVMVLAGAEGLLLKLGNTLKISGTEFLFRAASNPGQFDEKKYYYGEGFVYRISAKSITVTDSGYYVFKEKLRRLRDKMSSSIDASFDNEKAGVLKAMLVGDKSDLPEDVKELYKKSGIGHILAISGLHISIFGNAIFLLLRRLRVRLQAAGGISIFMLLSYGLLTGFSVSTSRAVVMTVLSIVAVCIGRSYDMLSGISAAAIIILTLNPGQVQAAGFLLSFGSATGVALFNEYIKIKNRALKAVVFSIALFAVNLPIIMCFYYEVSLIGILLNLIVIPAMSLLVPVGLLGAVFGAFGASKGALFIYGSANYILEGYDLLCKAGEQLSFSSIITGRPSGLRVFIYYLLLLLPFILSGLKERLSGVSKDDLFRKTMMGLFPALMTIGFFIIFTRHREFKVTMLDVGQGDAIVIENSNGNTYIVDCGSTSVKNVGKYRLIPFLKYEGVREVDALFYTHLDKDHISGGDELLASDEIGVKRFFVSDCFDEERSDAVLFDRGQVLRDSDLSLICLYSGKGAKDANDGSLVLLLKYRDFDMLLTGDISSAVEEKLLSVYPEGCDVDVLKVAHHGSKYSTCTAFLSWCTPEEAGISVSARNRYGHPSEDALSRLAAAGVSVRRTDMEG
ncbi:MAG: DNA internalization-related competence protein ComEC/Rec2, partial [Lachnospiraceae bacterium]|nr:DNA internalization-related competence protein ComEC/Rec2 [Lachnospiraceae bacterium]